MYLYLTTTGRVTGQPRQIEIGSLSMAGASILLPSARAPTGAQHPVAATGQDPFGDAEFNAIARVVHNDREPQLAVAVKALFDAKYGWSDGLMVELTPA